MKHLWWLAVFFVAILVIGTVSMSNRNNELRVREVEALEEIALNCGEAAMSLDNLTDGIYNIKDEIMLDLQNHLPSWAWERGKK